MAEHFRIAAKLGFKTLEFGLGGGQVGRLPADPTDHQISDFRALANRYGIATPGCCLENDFTLPDSQAHSEMLAATLDQVKAAARCGAKQVRLFAGFTPASQMSREIWDRMLSAFWAADALCVRLGLTIAIETHGRITFRNGAAHHEHTVTTEPAALRRLIEELPPLVGFNWDPGNLKAVAPNDRLCGLTLLNDRINYCHLKDWRRRADGWIACAIGDDDLDYGALFQQSRFKGVHLIEYEPTEDVEEGIQRSIDYLKRLGLQLEFV